MMTEQDMAQIAARGCTFTDIERQLITFAHGIPFVNLERPCTIGDGIYQVREEDLGTYGQKFEKVVADGRVSKFVPASGAASRMFKTLLAYLAQERQTNTRDSHAKPITHNENQHALDQWSRELPRFAFYDDLKSVLAGKGLQIETLLETKHLTPILEHCLTPVGLNYAKLPKGLIQFHAYSTGNRTPIEEHIVEAARYTQDRQRQARLHFTISPEHHDAIIQHITDIRKRLRNQGIEYLISYSHQKASTDTLAVDLFNQPFRDQDGQLLFRPSGHGALLDNLHDLQGDLVFIKNIDNVVPDRLKEEMYLYKRVMGGLLVSLQEQIAIHLTALTEENVQEGQIRTIASFAQEQLSITLPDAWDTWGGDKHIPFLLNTLNRPIRVCGMVRNTGDPGGGPFWVRHDNGSLSLQIVEMSQVDPHSPLQQKILNAATHFNPVDMVCGIRDSSGKPFHLFYYTDPLTGFITQKSYEGRNLKVLELPGLWNGAMANWITVFIEVPRSTFNPVKTIFDLLQPEHQPLATDS